MISLLEYKFVFKLNRKTKTIQKKKYILYECSGKDLCGGLADRFKGIINAYAWSLFTKRDLIVKITKPCQFTNLMLPSKVNWNIDLIKKIKYGNLKANYNIHNISKIDNTWYKNYLSNMDILNYQKESDVISLFSNLEWISSFSRNKYRFLFVCPFIKLTHS